MGERFPFSNIFMLEGEWIVCENEHQNLQAQRDIADNDRMLRTDFLTPEGILPKSGEVLNCSICNLKLFKKGPPFRPRHILKDTAFLG